MKKKIAKVEKEELNAYEQELLVCIAVQHKGLASVEEIQSKLEEQEIKMNKTTIKRLCKNLQKKDIISLNYEGSTTMFSMKKNLFARGVPTAHYKDFLKNDELAAELKERLEELEKIAGVNKGRKPDWCDYYTVKVQLKVTDGILGFMHKDKDVETLLHYREENGDLVLLPSHFKAWIRDNQRLINQTSMHRYIGFSKGHIVLNGSELGMKRYPVLDGHQGRGFRNYELVPKGAMIITQFDVPGKIPPEKFKAFIEQLGNRPLKGLTGRSSMGDFGRFTITEFDISK